MQSNVLYTLLIAATIVGACRNASTVSDTGDGSANARVLLEHEYINHAWGYAHFGIVITSDGLVHGYQWERGDAPSTSSEGPLISRAELDEKYAHGDTLVGRISADTLAMIEQLIPKAATGSLSERLSVGADMGKHEYIAYTVDGRSKMYKKITLRVTGDWEWSNTAREAQQLADILDAITRRSR